MHVCMFAWSYVCVCVVCIGVCVHVCVVYFFIEQLLLNKKNLDSYKPKTTIISYVVDGINLVQYIIPAKENARKF